MGELRKISKITKEVTQKGLASMQDNFCFFFCERKKKPHHTN